MRILLLSDLHGNMTATKAMEREMLDLWPDLVIFLGDAVGKGPRSDETLDWARKHCDLMIGGNWDYGLGEKQFPADGFYWDQLGQERLDYLKKLPREAELNVSGYRFRLIHGRPVMPLVKGFDPDEVLAEACRMSDGSEADGLIFGDSHRPFFRTAAGKYVMNTGSVGNNLGGIPRAHAILIEGKDGMAEKAGFRTTVISVPYDNEAEAKIAEETENMPKKEAYLKEIRTGRYGRNEVPISERH